MGFLREIDRRWGALLADAIVFVLALALVAAVVRAIGSGG